MSTLCRQIGLFVDGELSPGAAATFRQHLGQCKTCPAELEQILVLDTLAEQALGGPEVQPATMDLPACEGPFDEDPSSNPGSPASAAAEANRAPARRVRPKSIIERAWGWRLPRPIWIPLAVGAAATWALVRWGGSPGVTTPGSSALVALEAPPCRATLGRIAYAGYAQAIPCQVTRAADETGVGLPHTSPAVLARLQERDDYHGLAAAYLGERDLDRAEVYLAKAGVSEAVVSDQAVLALERGNFARALQIADAILVHAPDNPAAAWNRAVALERLGRRPEAAQQFSRIAAGGEAGWAGEAQRRAAALAAAGP